MRPLIAGNWKMHGTAAALAQIQALAAAAETLDCDLLICPPATLLHRAVAAADGRLGIGGQDCHWLASGAFTGDISASMLVDAGASAVILGHSERRQYHGETDQQVHAKAESAQAQGLLTLICVGENEAQRQAGQAEEVVGRQLRASLPAHSAPAGAVIAYEPVWAIGTGRTATAEDIVAMHGFIRATLGRVLGAAGEAMRVLYGGSVKGGNAGQILNLPEVGGALVGGASLKADELLTIARCARA